MLGEIDITRVDLNADAVPASPACGNECGARTGKWVQHRIADKAEHPDQTLGQHNGERRRMILRRSTGQLPDLLEPLPVLIFRNRAEHAHTGAGAPVAARFPFHQQVLDVMLDDSVGLVWFTKKAPATRLEVRIRDLVPDDRGEVVEADGTASLLY